MVIRALLAVALALGSGGCAVAWYAAGDAVDGEAEPVFAGDPVFERCVADPLSYGACAAGTTSYWCGAAVLRPAPPNSHGCEQAAPNLYDYICCPSP
jgi:hypothetical protein